MCAALETVAAGDAGDHADGLRGHGEHLQRPGGGRDRLFAEAHAAGGVARSDPGCAPGRVADDDAHCAEGGAILSADAAAAQPTENLSQREQEVLDLLSQGFLYKEIADKLGISYETVHTYIRRIYEKLQVRTRTEAVAKFLRR
jgi:DNA-binding CsgD family transcriptional regulator